jgi:hypothetical protein
MQDIKIYIGANNNTGIVEIDKINAVMKAAGFDGYTIIPSMGYWMGSSEQSIILEVSGNEKQIIRALIPTLKSELDQQAIGYTVGPAMKLI